jgi:hypothetical protein
MPRAFVLVSLMLSAHHVRRLGVPTIMPFAGVNRDNCTSVSYHAHRKSVDMT